MLLNRHNVPMLLPNGGGGSSVRTLQRIGNDLVILVAQASGTQPLVDIDECSLGCRSRIPTSAIPELSPDRTADPSTSASTRGQKSSPIGETCSRAGSKLTVIAGYNTASGEQTGGAKSAPQSRTAHEQLLLELRALPTLPLGLSTCAWLRVRSVRRGAALFARARGARDR
eukprot:6176307-Pleurochrysis_carterae.AAC.1